MIRCKLEAKLPSVNSLYWHRGNIKIMKTEAKQLRKDIILAREGDVKSEVQLVAFITVYGDWYFKNGKIRKRDVLNLQKFLIDSIFDGLEADDKQIFASYWVKKQADYDGFEVVIEEFKHG